MGLFDWLRGPKSQPRTVDRIWLTSRAKFVGIQQDIAQALNSVDGPDAVLVVAHFPDCLEALQTLVANAKFDDARVLVILSEALECRVTSLISGQSYRLHIVVGERHPLPSHDDALQQFARTISCECRLVQHLSLEDPLLREFAGEWVEKVLRQLGINENDAIESQIVSRRIRAAQEKISDRATGDSPAQSALEWLEKNCPNM